MSWADKRFFVKNVCLSSQYLIHSAKKHSGNKSKSPTNLSEQKHRGGYLYFSIKKKAL